MLDDDADADGGDAASGVGWPTGSVCSGSAVGSASVGASKSMPAVPWPGAMKGAACIAGRDGEGGGIENGDEGGEIEKGAGIDGGGDGGGDGDAASSMRRRASRIRNWVGAVMLAGGASLP